MATNLLLEGEDLEALLARAHAEGGSSARIVRAEKVRRGGVLGFFAREAFEVAVEIPDASPEPERGPRALAAALSAAVDPRLPEPTEKQLVRGGELYDRLAAALAEPPLPDDAPEPPRRPQPAAARAATRPAPPRPASPTPVVQAAVPPVVPPVAPPAATPLAQPADPFAAYAADLSDLEVPEPGRFAAQGLASMAERVNAAEQAAGRALADQLAKVRSPQPARPATAAASAIAAYGATASAAPAAPSAAVALLDRLLEVEQSLHPGGPDGGPGVVTAAPAARAAEPEPEIVPAPLPDPLPDPEPEPDTFAELLVGFLPQDDEPAADPSPETAECAPESAEWAPGATESAPGATEWAPGTVEVPAAAVPAMLVPHEPPADPVQPSTSKPAFSALLDQLRGSSGLAVPLQRIRPDQARRIVRPIEDEPQAEPGGAVPEPLTAPDIDQAGPSDDSADPSAHPIDSSDDSADPSAHSTDPSAHSTDPSAHSTDPSAHPTDPGAHSTDPSAHSAELGAHSAEVVARVARPVDPALVADRAMLRDLGVPAAWTRRLRAGDRFAAVRRMMVHMPVADVDPDAAVVAVVGVGGETVLEAHRVAVDLARGCRPRPVVVVPAGAGAEHDAAVVEAARTSDAVVAVLVRTTDAGAGEDVRATLDELGAEAVLAVVDAAAPLDDAETWVDALGRVDAVCLVGAAASGAPARSLALGLPVVRLDGVPVDHVTWTAFLCARLDSAALA